MEPFGFNRFWADEIRVIKSLASCQMDAYKLCKLARKPTPRATRDIGAWYLAFSLTSAISVMTNCALLAMDKDVQVRQVYLRSNFGRKVEN